MPSLLKQGVNDITILSPNNNTVQVEDMQNGTYAVRVALLMACSVKLVVNMDKDLPGTSGELPPVSLTFVSAAKAPAPVEEPKPAEGPAAAVDDVTDVAGGEAEQGQEAPVDVA